MMSLKDKIRDMAATITYKKFVLRHNFCIASSIETVKMIVDQKKSVARFGDGEFKWILKAKQVSFQDDDDELSNRLMQILRTDSPDCLICAPRPLCSDKDYSSLDKKFWHN